MSNILTNGNTKVKALLFDLPTSVCLQECSKCYAKKAEKRFPNVLKKRDSNYKISLEDSFVASIIKEIEKSKHDIVRIHSSGDFYSQEYIDKWSSIVSKLPNIKFYAYTKSKEKFNFKKIEKLKNINIINSITKLGVNYGDKAYCDKLISIGYLLCPCRKGIHVNCMIDCSLCLVEKNICFLEH